MLSGCLLMTEIPGVNTATCRKQRDMTTTTRANRGVGILASALLPKGFSGWRTPAVPRSVLVRKGDTLAALGLAHPHEETRGEPPDRPHIISFSPHHLISLPLFLVLTSAGSFGLFVLASFVRLEVRVNESQPASCRTSVFASFLSSTLSSANSPPLYAL